MPEYFFNECVSAANQKHFQISNEILRYIELNIIIEEGVILSFSQNSESLTSKKWWEYFRMKT